MNLPAQTGIGCDGARYRYRIFEEFSVDYNILYGNNMNATGSNVSLVMDIYQPLGDVVTNRPVVVVAHGGFFIGGSNDGADVVPLCQDLARMGYVAVSISYRLGLSNFFALESSLQEAVVRGVQDAKAAVRYLRKTHAEDGNTWGIDPERIVLGGSSAGGFIALHTAYVDDLSEIPSSVDFNANGLSGGIEGESGSPGYSSDILSIFSISGAIGNVDWISAGNTPVVSMHGTSDGTVPFGTGYRAIVGHQCNGRRWQRDYSQPSRFVRNGQLFPCLPRSWAYTTFVFYTILRYNKSRNCWLYKQTSVSFVSSNL